MEVLSPNCNNRMTSWGINGNILSSQRPAHLAKTEPLALSKEDT